LFRWRWRWKATFWRLTNTSFGAPSFRSIDLRNIVSSSKAKGESLIFSSILILTGELINFYNEGEKNKMPIDLAHNPGFIIYEFGVSNRFGRNAGFYKAIKELFLPETSIEPVANLG